MKNIYRGILLLLSFLLTACSFSHKISIGRKPERKAIVVKQKEKESRTSVPKFEDIDLYLKESYNLLSWDNIRRETYVNESTYLDVRTKELILKGKIRVSMLKEDVQASLGTPDKKIKSVTDFGLREKWIYSDKICIFDNGVLTDIEEIK